MKLRSSEIIYNQIRYDSRFDPEEFVIGYQSRFNGMKEITLTSFKPGLEIPWHRIWYFKTQAGMQWDRKQGIDKLLEISKTRDIEDTMKAKDILALGIPTEKLVGIVLQAIKNHPGRTDPTKIETEIKTILENPEANLEHEFFGVLAAELVKPKPLERRSEAAPYKIFGSNLEDGAIKQMHNAAMLPVAFAGALMPDAHQGYGLPIGGVLATENAVIPYAVGVDIACRMKLSILDMSITTAFKRRFEDLKRALETETKFGTGATWQRPLEHDVLDEDWTVTKVTEKLFDKARAQLGTSGSGNHFVEFGIVTLLKPEMNLEPGEYLALLSHSGSRGSGATIAKHYSDLAMDFHRELPPELKHLAWLNMDSEAGQEYWVAMNLMGLYASANHALIHKKVVKAIGAKVLAGVENHHNYCLPGDAIIATPCGPKKMIDLAQGDMVYALDDQKGLTETRVTQAWTSGHKQLRTIQTANRKIRASLEHPMLTIVLERRKAKSTEQQLFGHFCWKQARELQVGDIIVCAQGYYSEKESRGADLARFTGAFLGDGWIRHDTSHGRYTVGLAIGTSAESHTTLYQTLLERVLPTANWQVSRKGSFGLTCASAKVWRAIQAMGLGEYSKNKRLPLWAFRLPRNEKLALLAGYVDADGSVSNSQTSNHGRAVLASTNLELVQDLRELALGCQLRITPIRQTLVKSNFGAALVARCTLDADSTHQLPLWHPKKQTNQRNTKYQRSQGLESQKVGYLCLPEGIFAQRIRSIQDSSIEEPVFDISVKHASHSFIADGLVVHNCWKETHFGKEVIVHRKGATPAGMGVLGMIPGSMATPGFVVRGKGNKDSLESASHGAGRAMSRTKAKEQFTWKMVRPKLEEAGVTLLSAGIDENPFAYKDIEKVMAAQTELVHVIAKFDPKIVKMADAGEIPED